MKIFDYNTNRIEDSLIVGHKVRIDGTAKEVNTILRTVKYSTVAEGHEDNNSKRIYIEIIKTVKPSIAKILTIAKNEIKANNITQQELENISICELLVDTCDYIELCYNELVSVSNHEWNTIFDSIYCDCNSISEVKRNIVYSVIENEVIGVHTTIKQEKNRMIKEIKGE